MLVNVADDEFGKSLQRHGVEIGETGHKERRQDLVDGDEMCTLFLACAEAAVMREDVCDTSGKAQDDCVHMHMCDLELFVTVALEQTVDEHEGAEVGTHPAVLPEALQTGDRSGCDHLCHGGKVLEPCAVVDEGVLNASPLTVLCNTGLVVVTASLSADAVFCLPYRIKAFKLFVDQSNNFIKHA